jgi:cellulose biosynthesis protein BcsQ
LINFSISACIFEILQYKTNISIFYFFMAKIIALFNHKGGVSKTTTTFHLGWKLATLGQKVLIVDADPQCNLTGLTLGIEDYEKLHQFYEGKSNDNIYDALAPAFGLNDKSGTVDPITPAKTGNPNLFLLAGHIDFSKIDLQIATALTSTATIPILKGFVNAIYSLINKTAIRHEFDTVLIDMSPSVSATNMCLLMGSDYFIVPTSPDFYCFQAINSLASVLPQWSHDMKLFKNGEILPRANPKLLGIISQNYRVYGDNSDIENEEKQKKMTLAFEKWSSKIKEITISTLIPKLKDSNMSISEELFRKHVTYAQPFNLANIQNFNSLIPISQSLSKPMFELTQADYKPWVSKPAIWESERTSKDGTKKMVGAKYSILECDKIYNSFAQAIIDLSSI